MISFFSLSERSVLGHDCGVCFLLGVLKSGEHAGADAEERGAAQPPATTVLRDNSGDAIDTSSCFCHDMSVRP